jgi:predicted ArsR family transcriptional regulator
LEIAVASPLEGTRLKLLAIIRERGSATVDQLAQETDLSSATVRRHLDILQRDHLVSYQQSRKPQGRPEYLYSLTEEGHESGYRDYQKLLTLLISTIKGLSIPELADKDGKELIALLMSRISHRISDFSPHHESLSRDARVTQLEQLLTDSGYEPQIERNNGHIEVRLCNCPFRAAALCEESICLSDQYLIANVLGVLPVRQSSIRSGDPCCSYVAKLDD